MHTEAKPTAGRTSTFGIYIGSGDIDPLHPLQPGFWPPPASTRRASCASGWPIISTLIPSSGRGKSRSRSHQNKYASVPTQTEDSVIRSWPGLTRGPSARGLDPWASTDRSSLAAFRGVPGSCRVGRAEVEGQGCPGSDEQHIDIKVAGLITAVWKGVLGIVEVVAADCRAGWSG